MPSYSQSIVIQSSKCTSIYFKAWRGLLILHQKKKTSLLLLGGVKDDRHRSADFQPNVEWHMAQHDIMVQLEGGAKKLILDSVKLVVRRN